MCAAHSRSNALSWARMASMPPPLLRGCFLKQFLARATAVSCKNTSGMSGGWVLASSPARGRKPCSLTNKKRWLDSQGGVSPAGVQQHFGAKTGRPCGWTQFSQLNNYNILKVQTPRSPELLGGPRAHQKEPNPTKRVPNALYGGPGESG